MGAEHHSRDGTQVRNMKTQTKTVRLDRPGVDAASETIRNWLESAGVPERDVLRIRLTMEELLNRISEHGEGCVEAEVRFRRRIGEWRLYVLYGGDRFDPAGQKESEVDTWTADLLARTGFVPLWRWRARRNELLLRIPSGKRRRDLLPVDHYASASYPAGRAGTRRYDRDAHGLSDYGRAHHDAASGNDPSG